MQTEALIRRLTFVKLGYDINFKLINLLTTFIRNFSVDTNI